MQYFLKSARLWNHTLLDKENSKLVAIIFKDKTFNNNAKLEHQEKQTKKIII